MKQRDIPFLKRKTSLVLLARRKHTQVKRIDVQNELELLRQFDLKVKYGPNIGLTRRERLLRAERIFSKDKSYLDEIKKTLRQYNTQGRDAALEEIQQPLWFKANPKP